jgi:hypothetical protein
MTAVVLYINFLQGLHMHLLQSQCHSVDSVFHFKQATRPCDHSYHLS